LGGSEKAYPWRVPPSWLGWRYAADVLLHEAYRTARDLLRDRGRGAELSWKSRGCTVALTGEYSRVDTED
jgi:hypothetical protein